MKNKFIIPSVIIVCGFIISSFVLKNNSNPYKICLNDVEQQEKNYFKVLEDRLKFKVEIDKEYEIQSKYIIQKYEEDLKNTKTSLDEFSINSKKEEDLGKLRIKISENIAPNIDWETNFYKESELYKCKTLYGK